MKKNIKILLTLSLISAWGNVHAQYYDWGQEPASVRWMQIGSGKSKIVFPEYYSEQAQRLSFYMDTVRPQIGYGFRHDPMRLPLVLHTQNFQSNGIVMLAPNRMEFIVTPQANQSAMPWLKQLAVHEYRHAVHYSNVNRGVIRPLSWLLGQQGSLVGIIFLPQWMIEGDAVMAETQMSSFGRGWQPSFTIEYRALADEGRRFVPDKYFSGSYKDYLPNHYQLGYQIVTYAYTKYGENIWDRTARFATHRPYVIATNKVALNKYYGTSVKELLGETFDDLEEHWRSLPPREDTPEIIPTRTTSYTTYMTPVAIDEQTVVAIKSDLDRSYRLVSIDTRTGRERTLKNIGVVNTGLTHHDGIIYWTEYRQSTFWDQRVGSLLCSYDLRSGRSSTYTDRRRVMWSAAMPDGNVAIAEYHPEGNFTVTFGSNEITLPIDVSVHGLACDPSDGKVYAILLDDDGMRISLLGSDRTVTDVTEPGYTTLSNLRAESGRLYYGSIGTGYDEAHMFDTRTGREYCLSESRYGSFQPAPVPGTEDVVMTTYTARGYLPSVLRDPDGKAREYTATAIPCDVVNPDRIDLGLMNIDSVRYIASAHRPKPEKRYRKGLHLFQLHSWMPIDIDPERVIDESKFDLGVGVTLLSQNLLNSTFGQLGYGYSDGHSHVRGKLGYYGWAPKFDIEATWSDKKQYYNTMQGVAAPTNLKNYFDITASAYLPVLLSSGHHIRRLTPMVQFSHTNTLLFDPTKNNYRAGNDKAVVSLQFSDYVRQAYRDFLPRWGYNLRAAFTFNPVRSNFAEIYSLYGRVYTPGIALHHSLMIRAVGQYQKTDDYNYRQKELFPRYADYNFTAHRYGAVSADYQFPLWYPDGGINSIIYFKRIRLNLAGDYARYESLAGTKRHLWSYGAELVIDAAPFRLPSSTTATVTISVFNPSNRKGVSAGVGVSIPL